MDLPFDIGLRKHPLLGPEKAVVVSSSITLPSDRVHLPGISRYLGLGKTSSPATVASEGEIAIFI